MHNKETGEVTMLDDELVQKLEMAKDRLHLWQQIQLASLPEKQQKQLKEDGKTKIGRNDSCPCGSGKKFKKCCLTPFSKRVPIKFDV